MKNDILINDVIKQVNTLMLEFDMYYTMKNIKK